MMKMNKEQKEKYDEIINVLMNLEKLMSQFDIR